MFEIIAAVFVLWHMKLVTDDIYAAMQLPATHQKLARKTVFHAVFTMVVCMLFITAQAAIVSGMPAAAGPDYQTGVRFIRAVSAGMFLMNIAISHLKIRPEIKMALA